MKTPVTVLGLGAMGTALARALLAAGHPTTVWNRTPGRSPELDELGATRAGTPADAVAASPLVIVCLLVDATVRATLDGVDLTGRTVVNLTNSTPEQSRTTAERFGASYLDGGIMAVPAMIGTPGAFIFYSGVPEAFEKYRAELSVLARPAYVGEDPGLAALYDIALLSAMYGMFGGAQHALALMANAGVPATAFTEQFLSPWLTAMLASIPRMAGELDNGPVDTAGSNLAMQAAAYENLVTAAQTQGVDPRLLVPMGELLAEAVAAGHGDEGLSALVGLLRSA
ncbi:3-hydroxyisobutyrate dehydrogenase-like beta-hydroxyacid dehydrogenase [Kribbella aluminosa]|uniref:3-hydroxyisobutyrate dehydrogenase-like beta-hydroxyacid dehydrogenase n=1 Tax=Kribbella aluminosa TaxID=416017 RepID=A0ABS4UDL0_9ACTN|nr:NAD(P)-binding domain-containing protein [Kribbella aluminosa]MBP2349729.1 3-hydroxyisobutyrate dehydrogenase-like beta-hydroxyacid dehydrogenase [Kribbella aluminosa]